MKGKSQEKDIMRHSNLPIQWCTREMQTVPFASTCLKRVARAAACSSFREPCGLWISVVVSAIWPDQNEAIVGCWSDSVRTVPSDHWIFGALVSSMGSVNPNCKLESDSRMLRIMKWMQRSSEPVYFVVFCLCYCIFAIFRTSSICCSFLGCAIRCHD
jgi:hypothetical protein